MLAKTQIEDDVNFEQEQINLILEGIAACERGDYASEEDVSAFFDKYKLK